MGKEEESVPGQIETTLKVALDTLTRTFPDGAEYDNLAKCIRLMPHVTSVLNYIGQYQPSGSSQIGGQSSEAHWPSLSRRWPALHHNCGGSWSTRGNYTEALRCY